MQERERVKPTRAKAKHVYFTDAAIAKHAPKKKQYLIWDAWLPERRRGAPPARGLCVLVSPRGAKSFRAVFYYPGSPKPHYKHLGRVGEMSLEEARRLCGEVRAMAKEGRDPNAGNPANSGSFEKVFADFIQHEQLGRRKNKSALKTQSFVLKNSAAWHQRPVATIRASEVEALLWGIRDGDPDKGLKPRPAAATRIFAHLRDFFSWCSREGGPVKTSPMQKMSPPSTVVARDRVYSDDEIKAIWKAADKLDAADGSYVKLILLLALRREELAQAKWSEFDNPDAPTLLTIPFERTKGKLTRKRKTTYIVPLPLLAQRIIKSLPGDGEKVFPRIDAQRIKDKLVAEGAPADFTLHVSRHTVATWLQNQNHSEWEVGLVLNHAASGVTAGYSHGYPRDRKFELLTKWADHVERLVQPEGVALLR